MRRSLARAMTFVPKDVAVLSGAVAENLAMGIPSEFIDNSLVWEALERAKAASQDRSGSALPPAFAGA